MVHHYTIIILEKGQACMIRSMNLEEGKLICLDRSQWIKPVSAYHPGKRRYFRYMYTHMFIRCHYYLYIVPNGDKLNLKKYASQFRNLHSIYWDESR